jgi:hypothetical protein
VVLPPALPRRPAVGFTPGQAAGTVAVMAVTTAAVVLAALAPLAAGAASVVPARRATTVRPAPARRVG